MGKPDAVTKEYVSRSDIFADIFNNYLYGGRQVIDPSHLKERDITEIALPFGNISGGTVQKYRDVFKILQIMEDENAVYVLLGTELQMKIHYAMPVKSMLYDSVNYAEQISTAAREHRKEKGKSLSGDEYLSGFSKKDKLIPVITLTIYFGSKKWDGPMRLHEMFAKSNQSLLRFIPDYKINLITPAGLSEEDLEKFHTEFRMVMKFIKYSDDKDALQKMLDRDETFKTVSRETANLINIVTNSGIEIKENEEVIDMCKAVKEIKEEGRLEGREETIVDSIQKLMRTMTLTAQQAMEALEIPPADQQRYLTML